MDFRTTHQEKLGEIPEKANARVLGTLDVLARQVLLEECAQWEVPANSVEDSPPRAQGEILAGLRHRRLL